MIKYLKYLFILCLFVCQSVFSQINNQFPYNFTRLVLAGGSGMDETIIYFDDSATDGYDEQFDAIKMLSSNPGVPNIYSIIDDANYSINVMGRFDKDKTIPLGLSITQSGIYTLSILEKKEFIIGTGLYLEDRQENKFYNLNVEEKITLNLISSTILNRFFIHYYFYPYILISDETCNLYDGSIEFQNRSSNLWNVKLYFEGDSIGNFNEVSDVVKFNKLNGGNYIIELYKKEGEKLKLDIEVGHGLRIDSDFFTSKETYKAGEQILFEAYQKTPNLFYMWDFGDGENIRTFDSVIEHIYKEPGIYTINLLVTNGECYFNSEKILKITPNTITSIPKYISKIKIYPNPVIDLINVVISKEIVNKVQYIEIKDLTGKTISKHLVSKQEKESESFRIQLKDIESGNYFLNLVGTHEYEVVNFMVIK